MLADNDPLKGYIDRLVQEGNTEKITTLKNFYLLGWEAYGIDIEKSKQQMIEQGYGSEESINSMFSTVS